MRPGPSHLLLVVAVSIGVGCGSSSGPAEVPVELTIASATPLGAGSPESSQSPATPRHVAELPATSTAAPVVPGGTASSEQKARAEQLFTEARQLMSAGKYPEACAKLEASMSSDPGVGTLVNLASCREHVGDKGGACDAYRQARSMDPGDARKAFIERQALGLGCPPIY